MNQSSKPPAQTPNWHASTAADLRRIADLIETHPDLPVPLKEYGNRESTADFMVSFATRQGTEVVDAWARVLDMPTPGLHAIAGDDVYDSMLLDGPVLMRLRVEVPQATPEEIDAALAFYREHRPQAGGES